jgi:hypothetical protein
LTVVMSAGCSPAPPDTANELRIVSSDGSAEQGPIVGGAYGPASGAEGPSLLVLKRDGSSNMLSGRFLLRAGGRCLLPSCADAAEGQWTAIREVGITTIALQATLDGVRLWQRTLIAFDAPDGIHVVDPLDGAADLVSQAPCQQTGCYGQVCAGSRIITPCIYRPEDACYLKDGFCARDSSGTCGWVATPELQQCIDDPPCGAMARRDHLPYAARHLRRAAVHQRPLDVPAR